MKSYLSLISISAKKRRHKNKITLFCIIIAVFLVTVIFSMADMGIRMEKMRLIDKHGNLHIMLDGISENTWDEIRTRKDVASASRYRVMNYSIDKDYYINGKKTVFCGIDEPFMNMWNGFTKHAYPKNDSEIILSSNANDILGINIGDTITLNTPNGDIEFVVSGFSDNTAMVLQYDAIGAFMTTAAFYNVCALNDTEIPSAAYYVQFREHVNIRKMISDIKTQYHLTEEQLSENTALLGVMGFSGDSYMMGLYGVAAVLFILVLMAGVLMIAGSINSNIVERTQFFGMMRCIGASRKQIISFVRLEALNWCKTAIPIGIVSGVLMTWGICALFKLVVSGEFTYIPLFEISMIGIVCGILVGLLTVLFAAQSPAKRAAKVSPMAAVSGEKSTKNIRHGTKMFFFKIETALGIHHAVSAKRNLILMTGSFALSIILFLSFSTMFDFAKHALNPLNPSAPDISFMSHDRSNTVDYNLIDKINHIHGVEKSFGRMFREGLPAEYSGKTDQIDLISYEQYQFEWAEADVLEGDLSKVYGNSNFVLAVYDDKAFQVGDKIKLENAELEVAAILAEAPFGSDENPTVICSEETFTALTGEKNYAVIDIQLNGNATDAAAESLRNLAGENMFSDRRESNRETIAVYWAFRFLVYGFLMIIAMITVFNIINSIAMSVSARVKQYGAMRAVGMDGRQMTKMIAAESITYAFFGCIAGVVIGLLLHKFLFDRLVTAYFGTVWSLPVVTLGIVLLLVAASSAAAVYMPAKRIVSMAVTDTINEL